MLVSMPMLAAVLVLLLVVLSDGGVGTLAGLALGIEGAYAGELDGVLVVPPTPIARPRRSLLARARHGVGRAWRRLPYELQPARLRNRTNWAIGLFSGSDPLHLAPMPGIQNPIVTGYSVRDAEAGFVADPFLFSWDGRWYLFYEVFNYGSARGEIGVSSSSDLRTWKYEGLALVEPHHLSYPLVFETDGVPHMVLESSEIGVVRAYRATDFPMRWEPAVDLLDDEPRQDPTLFEHDGRWWLFTAGRDDSRRWGKLDLHVADHPLGPFEPHPSNPIVYNDPTIARPAGRVVRDGDRLMRFGQDCSTDYGLQVWASTIDCLTPHEYAETPLREEPVIAPTGRGWTRRRMHHVDAHQMPDGSWIAAVDGW